MSLWIQHVQSAHQLLGTQGQTRQKVPEPLKLTTWGKDTIKQTVTKGIGLMKSQWASARWIGVQGREFKLFRAEQTQVREAEWVLGTEVRALNLDSKAWRWKTRGHSGEDKGWTPAVPQT
jgi:hypothetical protein